jgi:hypothetical protein
MPIYKSSPAPQQEFQEAYYRKGKYLNEITSVKLNKNGEPFITFKVIASHDGGHVNSYYGINFFNGKMRSMPSQTMWNGKWSGLLHALGYESKSGGDIELDDFIGMQVVLSYRKAGYKPLPDFSKADSAPELVVPEMMKPPEAHPANESLDSFMDETAELAKMGEQDVPPIEAYG